TVVNTTSESLLVGSADVTVGHQWYSYELNLLQDAFYAPASGAIREALIAGLDFQPASLSWGSAGAPATDLSWSQYSPGQREVVLQALGYLPLYAVDVANVQQITVRNGVETREAVANPWFNDPTRLVMPSSGPLRGMAIVGPEGAFSQAQLTSAPVAPTQALTLQGTTTATLPAVVQPVTGLTLEAWVWLDPTAPADGVLLRTELPVGTVNQTIELSLRNGTLNLSHLQDSSRQANGSSVIERGQWVHVAASMTITPASGGLGVTTLYINGVEEPLTRTVANNGVRLNSLTRLAGLTLTPSSSAGALRGAIRQLKVWSEGRSAAQVVQDMTAPPSGTESGLAHWYSLEGSLASAMPGRAALQIPTGSAASFAVREGLNGPGADGSWQELVGSSSFSADVIYTQTGSALTATTLRQTVTNPAAGGEGILQANVADPDQGSALWSVSYDGAGERSLTLRRSRTLLSGSGFATSTPRATGGRVLQKPFWVDNTTQAISSYNADKPAAYGIGRGLAPLLQGATPQALPAGQQTAYSLSLTAAGGLALTAPDGRVLWQATNSNGTAVTGGAVAVMQPDGNFVLYSSTVGGRALWASNTQTPLANQRRQLRLTSTGALQIVDATGAVVRSLYTAPDGATPQGGGAVLPAGADLQLSATGVTPESRRVLRSARSQDWSVASTSLSASGVFTATVLSASGGQALPATQIDLGLYGPGFLTQGTQGLATRLDPGALGNRLSLSLHRLDEWGPDSQLGIYYRIDGASAAVPLLLQPLRSASPLEAAVSNSVTIGGLPAFLTLTPRPFVGNTYGNTAFPEQTLDLQLTLAPGTPAGTLFLAPFGSVAVAGVVQRPRLAISLNDIALSWADQLPRLRAPASSTSVALDYIASTDYLGRGILRNTSVRNVGTLPATPPLLQAWRSTADFNQAAQQSPQLQVSAGNGGRYGWFSQLADVRNPTEVQVARTALINAGLTQALVNGLQATNSPLWTTLEGRPLSQDWGQREIYYTTAAGSWPQVAQFALGRDASLATILSATDQQRAFNSLSSQVRTNFQGVWLGGARDAAGTLRWSDGSRVGDSGYTNWSPGEPNNLPRQYRVGFIFTNTTLSAVDPDSPVSGSKAGEAFLAMSTNGSWNDIFSRREFPIPWGSTATSGIPNRQTEPSAYATVYPGLARQVVPNLPWLDGEPNDGNNDFTANDENYLELRNSGFFNDVPLAGNRSAPNRGYLTRTSPIWGPGRALQEIWSDTIYPWVSIPLPDSDRRQNLSFRATGVATPLIEKQPVYQQQEITTRTDLQELSPLQMLRPVFSNSTRTTGVEVQTETVNLRGKAVPFESLRGRSITLLSSADTRLQGNVASTADDGRLQIRAGGSIRVSGPDDDGESGHPSPSSAHTELPTTLQADSFQLQAGNGLQLGSGVLLADSSADPGGQVDSIALDAGAGTFSSQASMAPSASLQLAGATLARPVGGSRPLQTERLQLSFGEQLSLTASQPQGQSLPLLLELGEATTGDSQAVRLSSSDATGTLQLSALRTTLPLLVRSAGTLELGGSLRGERLTLEAARFTEASPGITLEASVSLTLLETGDAPFLGAGSTTAAPALAKAASTPDLRPLLRAPSLRISGGGDLRADVEASELDLRLGGSVLLRNRADGLSRLRLSGGGVQQLTFAGPVDLEALAAAGGRVSLAVDHGDLRLGSLDQQDDGELQLLVHRGRIAALADVPAAERRLGRLWARAGSGVDLDLQRLTRLNAISERGNLAITVDGTPGSLLEVEALQSYGSAAALEGQVELSSGAASLRLAAVEQIRSNRLRLSAAGALIIDPLKPVTLRAAETLALSAGSFSLDPVRLTLQARDTISLDFQQLAQADALPALPLLATESLQLSGNGGVRYTERTWHPEQNSQPFGSLTLKASASTAAPRLRSLTTATATAVPVRWPYDLQQETQLLEDDDGVPYVLRSSDPQAATGAPLPYTHYAPDPLAHAGYPYRYSALAREGGYGSDAIRVFRSSERLLTAANLGTAALEGLTADEIDPATIQPVLTARPVSDLRPAVGLGLPQATRIGSLQPAQLASSVSVTSDGPGLELSDALDGLIRKVPAVLSGRDSQGLKGAHVWFDSDGDLQRDPDEPQSLTLADGSFRLALPAAGAQGRLVSDGGSDPISGVARGLRLIAGTTNPLFEIDTSLQQLLADRGLNSLQIQAALVGFEPTDGQERSLGSVVRSSQEQLAMQLALVLGTGLQRTEPQALNALSDSLLALQPPAPGQLDWVALSRGLITRLQDGATLPAAQAQALATLPPFIGAVMQRFSGIRRDLRELQPAAADPAALIDAAEAIGRRLLDRVQLKLPALLNGDLLPETALQSLDAWIRTGLQPILSESPPVASVEAFGSAVPAGGSASFQIQLDAPAPAGGLNVEYACYGPILRTGSVWLEEGRSSALVTIEVPEDAASGVLQLVLLNLGERFQVDPAAAAARIRVAAGPESIGKGAPFDDGRLRGSEADELLQPDADHPVVVSGPGRDRLVIRPQDTRPLVLDFNPQRGDRIQLLRSDFPGLALADLAVVGGHLLLHGRPIALLQGEETTITFLRDVSGIVELVDAPTPAPQLAVPLDPDSRRQSLPAGRLGLVNSGSNQERVVLASQLPPPPQPGDGLLWLGDGLALSREDEGPRLVRLQAVAAESLASRQLSLLLYRTDAQGRPLAADGISPAASPLEAVIAQIGTVPDDAGRTLFASGSTSLLLEPGQQLRALLSRGNAPLVEQPPLQVNADGSGLRLQLGAAGAPELVLRASLTAASEVDLQLESARRIGLGDLLFFNAGDQVDVDVWSSCGFTNTLGFVRVDIDLGDDPANPRLSVAGNALRNDDAFRRIVSDNLDPGLRVSQGGDNHSSHLWTVTDTGFYSPVMISQLGEVFALGTAINRDRQVHLQGLGDGAYGFEDLAADQGSDFDHNDGILRIQRRAAAVSPVVLATGAGGLELAGAVNLLGDRNNQLVSTSALQASRITLAAGRDTVLRQGHHADAIDLGADDDALVLGRQGGGASIRLGEGRDRVIIGNGSRLAPGDPDHSQAAAGEANGPVSAEVSGEAPAALPRRPDRLADFDPSRDHLLVVGNAPVQLEQTPEGVLLRLDAQPLLLLEGLSSTETVQAAIAQEGQAAGDLIPRLQQRGVLNVALPHDRPGLSQRDANGLWSGTAVDLVRAI
ncbi:MAG: LamG-like jellyroll fold domain-containing protein, partial [Synechococcaceae cyanobacterium]|nr:LamG-like jellyroll fold domain-containing protein [Synechococcaceae cyanobacterium]